MSWDCPIIRKAVYLFRKVRRIFSLISYHFLHMVKYSKFIFYVIVEKNLVGYKNY